MPQPCRANEHAKILTSGSKVLLPRSHDPILERQGQRFAAPWHASVRKARSSRLWSCSVQMLAKHTKKKTLANLCHGIEINDTYASIAKLGDALWFGDVLRKHNDDDDDYHFSYPHAFICIMIGINIQELPVMTCF